MTVRRKDFRLRELDSGTSSHQLRLVGKRKDQNATMEQSENYRREKAKVNYLKKRGVLEASQETIEVGVITCKDKHPKTV